MEKQLSREMLEALVEVQAQLNKMEFGEMLEFLVRQIIKTLHVERCAIFRILPDETACLITGEPRDKHGLGMKFSFDQLPLMKDAVESKSYLLSEEPWKDERTLNTRELIYHEGINAILLLPLLAQDEVIGVIAIDATKDKKSFSEEEIYFCLILANQASLLLERDLRHKEREEKEVLVIFGQAAAEAAHRILNPLVVIGGFARRLVKKLENSPLQKDAQTIVESVDKLEEIVNRLLKFSRDKRVNLVKTDINEIIKESGEVAFGLIGEKDIKIDYQLNPLPSVLVNPEEIKEVFLDILRNAVEAIKEKGRIFVKSRKEEDVIKISITNTGGCIDEEIVQQIFNPFFTTKPGGTGLGLAIANATVSAYGGEIRVENDRELNLTTFIVKLPTNLTSERR